MKDKSIDNLLNELTSRKISIDKDKYKAWLFEYAMKTLEYEEKRRDDEAIRRIIIDKLTHGLLVVDQLYRDYGYIHKVDIFPLKEIPKIVEYEHQKRERQESILRERINAANQ
jgi:hypothetical protein